jgi:hypothetical protein
MPNADDTKSIKISLNTYNILKPHVDKRQYKLGGYVDRAILHFIEAELKREKRKTSKK